jgi:hypothetical protein
MDNSIGVSWRKTQQTQLDKAAKIYYEFCEFLFHSGTRSTHLVGKTYQKVLEVSIPLWNKINNNCLFTNANYACFHSTLEQDQPMHLLFDRYLRYRFHSTLEQDQLNVRFLAVRLWFCFHSTLEQDQRLS